MNRTQRILVTAALTLAAVAQMNPSAAAGVSLNASRVAAVDVAGTAKFYEAAFGLQEVRRFEFPGSLEILMNFGASVAAAKANTSAQIVIMHRDSDAASDPIAHLILTVTDIDATVQAIKAAGGRMDREPREFQKTGIMIGIAVDPAGNHIEMIQQPRK